MAWVQILPSINYHIERLIFKNYWIVIKDSCPYSGSIGSLSRPIKTIIDARFTGHEFHEELNYPISYPPIGDCLDRYIPRFNEIIKSCCIIHGLFYILLSSGN